MEGLVGLILFVVLASIIVAPILFARRKGYSGGAWALTGLFGLILLAFLPNVTDWHENAQSAGSKKVGNTVGLVLTLVGLGVVVLQIVGAMAS